MLARFVFILMFCFMSTSISGCLDQQKAAGNAAAEGAAMAFRMSTVLTFHDKEVNVKVGGDSGKTVVDLNLEDQLVTGSPNETKYEFKIVDEKNQPIEGVGERIFSVTKSAPHSEVQFQPQKPVNCVAYIAWQLPSGGEWKQYSHLTLKAI